MKPVSKKYILNIHILVGSENVIKEFFFADYETGFSFWLTEVEK